MGKQSKSLKDSFNHAAIGVAGIGAAASVIMSAGVGPIGLAASGVMGAAAAIGFAFRKKFAAATLFEEASEPAPPAPEIEISIETGAPVKAMKQIRLRK